MSYTILQDTREQHPLDFSFYPQCENVIIQKIHEGDYTILGLEDKVRIERKMTTSEIASNIGLDSERFEKELERLANIKYTYLVCEFTINDLLIFPKNSGIPARLLSKIKINGKFILKKLKEYEDEYGIFLEFCGDRDGAARRVIEIFDYVNKLCKE